MRTLPRWPFAPIPVGGKMAPSKFSVVPAIASQGMPPARPDDGHQGAHLLGAGTLVHEQHHVAVALVDDVGVLRGHDGANSAGGHVAEAPLLDVIADDEFADALVGRPPEVAVAAEGTIAGLDALGPDAIRGGAGAPAGVMLDSLGLRR